MDLQGNLIKPVCVEFKDAECTDDSINFILFFPAEFNTFKNAINVRHKLRYGTMGKDFQTKDSDSADKNSNYMQRVLCQVYIIQS